MIFMLVAFENIIVFNENVYAWRSNYNIDK